MKTVAIDLDGTLAHYDGWKGEDTIGDPLPGAQDFIAELARRGYEPVIHTTRQDWRVQLWLERHGFLAVRVATAKPAAIVYIDDRAVRFQGDFAAMLDAIETPTWWEPKVPPA